MKRVMCFGTFDLVHPGHVKFLRAARARGDELYVVVATDARRAALTHARPLFTQRERMNVLREMRSVTQVIPGHRTDMLAAVKKIKPQIIVLGHDQHFGVAELTAWCATQKPRPRIVRLSAFARDRYASSRLRHLVT